MFFFLGGGGVGVGGRDPKPNISRFQICRGWHLLVVVVAVVTTMMMMTTMIMMLGVVFSLVNSLSVVTHDLRYIYM